MLSGKDPANGFFSLSLLLLLDAFLTSLKSVFLFYAPKLNDALKSLIKVFIFYYFEGCRSSFQLFKVLI